MIEQRVEKHKISCFDAHFTLLSDFCHKAKNLYNHANYIIRQEYIKYGKTLSYGALDKLLKHDKEYPDYQAMPTAQTAQQVLRMLSSNWKAYKHALADYYKNSDKYLGKPNIPGYLNRNGSYVLCLTNQNCKLKQDGYIHFPKVFQGFTVKPCFTNRTDFVSFQQVRLIPHRNSIVVEVVYNIVVPEECNDNGRYVGIDIGVNNLAAVCNNVGLSAFILNGRPLKSTNQYYNKLVSHYTSIAKRVNDKYSTDRIDRITERRNRKINDYLHKASRYVVDFCVKHNICKIVIGKNKNWKQCSNMNSKENQQFVQIPFARFIDMITYKAKEFGIAVVTTEESYTSGTSFIDNELPVAGCYNKARRVARGLFVSNKGVTINADLNSAYQILKKVVPIKWDSGCVLHPSVVTLS